MARYHSIELLELATIWTGVAARGALFEHEYIGTRLDSAGRKVFFILPHLRRAAHEDVRRELLAKAVGMAVVCATCGKAAKDVCSKCHEVPYCSRPCQQKAWKEHGRVCKRKMSHDDFWLFFTAGKCSIFNGSLMSVVHRLRKAGVVITCEGSEIKEATLLRNVQLPVAQEVVKVILKADATQLPPDGFDLASFPAHAVARAQHLAEVEITDFKLDACTPLTCVQTAHLGFHHVGQVELADGRKFIVDLTAAQFGDREAVYQETPWKLVPVQIFLEHARSCELMTSVSTAMLEISIQILRSSQAESLLATHMLYMVNETEQAARRKLGLVKTRKRRA
jgi:hypothetical protein